MNTHRQLPQQAIRPETTPLYSASVYTFPSLEHVRDYYADNATGQFLYQRNGHPNQAVVEAWLARLEHSDDAMLCASGMAAISQACLAHLKPGDHVLSTQYLYGGTYAFFENVLRPWGVDVTYTDVDALEQLEQQVRPNTKLLYAETIANPLLQVSHIPRLASFARSNQLQLFVDNTFATPMLVNPVTLGATLSIHSLTKYLNGHSDVIGGAVMGSPDAVQQVRQFAVTCGATLAPFDAWMTERGLHTFHLRFPVQCDNAMAISRFLESRAEINAVYYPGLATHPTHAAAADMFTDRFGAIVSFDLKGGLSAAEALVDHFSHIQFAPSLGGVKTTVSHPALTSHRAFNSEQRASLGITDGLLRLSAGVEELQSLLSDLEQALAHIH